MCLAIPGKILATEEVAGLREGTIQFGGITRHANLDFVPEAMVGDFVLVHVGFAITRVDSEEAERTLQLLGEMGLREELGLQPQEGSPQEGSSQEGSGA